MHTHAHTFHIGNNTTFLMSQGLEKRGSVITVTTSAQRSSGEWALCVSVHECLCVCVVWRTGYQETQHERVSERDEQWPRFRPAGQWVSIRPG